MNQIEPKNVIPIPENAEHFIAVYRTGTYWGAGMVCRTAIDAEKSIQGFTCDEAHLIRVILPTGVTQDEA